MWRRKWRLEGVSRLGTGNKTKFTVGQARQPNPGPLKCVVGTNPLTVPACIFPLPDERQTQLTTTTQLEALGSLSPFLHSKPTPSPSWLPQKMAGSLPGFTCSPLGAGQVLVPSPQIQPFAGLRHLPCLLCPLGLPGWLES